MTARVEVSPTLLRWACERSGRDLTTFASRFPRLDAWLEGDASPTLKQLEDFAKATYTPVGYLFLAEPPVERVPIPDYRTFPGREVRRPSADLLETIYQCQQRQEWYRDFARSMREPPLPFVGSLRVGDSIEKAAGTMRDALGFDVAARRRMPTWAEALRHFRQQADAMGVLLMWSGVVGNDSHRHLDPEEFRGFAMADDLAPIVFINGADTKAAQMFTLAHELVHVWLGQSALSDVEPARSTKNEVERWCNQVAAELLVPLAAMRAEYRPRNPLDVEMQRLARCFKVSALVVLRRLHDLGALSREAMWREYQREAARLEALVKGGGGDFYRTQTARVGERFARALVVSTLEGQTLHRDAFRMLGISKLETFRQLADKLGVT